MIDKCLAISIKRAGVLLLHSSLLSRDAKGFFSSGKDPLSNVSARTGLPKAQGYWRRRKARDRFIQLCACTHFTQRIYITNVRNSPEERDSTLGRMLGHWRVLTSIQFPVIHLCTRLNYQPLLGKGVGMEPVYAPE